MAKKRSLLDRSLSVPGDKPATPLKLTDLRELIEVIRAGVAQAVNSALVLLLAGRTSNPDWGGSDLRIQASIDPPDLDEGNFLKR
jgi:hypothetical protein